jgi:hypothetical protein
MPATGVQRRICIINPEGGNLRVVLLANNALRAGADFRIVKTAGSPPRETWKMAAGDTGAGVHDVATRPDALDGNIIAWEILVCAQVPAIDTGAVEIQIHQDGVTCPLTKPAHWSLEQVPQCQKKKVKPLSIRGNLKLIAG